MSTTTNEVQIGILFEDGTVRTYSLPNVDSSDLAGIKTRVLEINNGTGVGATYKPAMLATFVSNTGASMQKISKAAYIISTEEVIYDG